MRYSLAILLIAGLLISLAGNLILYNTTYHYYTALNATRLDPLQLGDYPPTAWPDGNPGAVKVLFVGDSRAFNWPALVADERWRFLNRGIGGQTSSQVQLRFAEHVTPLQPDVVIIQVSINDLKTIPLFPEQRAAIAATCQRNLADMVAQARALGAKVILTTIFPVGELSLARRLVWSPAVGEAVAEVNAYLHTLAGPDVVIFDSAAILADDRGNTRPEYQVDLLHINAAGYAALNAHLRPLLQTLP
jgi:lysophospholipase L1-like esterase